ncbi:MAG: hypothetical protein JXR36_03335 [Bacteroidales bacterium]|nr:hypothetical protein [Bacteroidales bacterium]
MALFSFAKVKENRFSQNVQLYEQLKKGYKTPVFHFGEERYYWICGVMEEYLDSLQKDERNLLVEKALSSVDAFMGEEVTSTQEYADLIDELAGLKDITFDTIRLDWFITCDVTYSKVRERTLERMKNRPFF